MSPQAEQGMPGTSSAIAPIAIPSVPALPLSRRAWNAALPLHWVLWWVFMFALPNRLEAGHPVLRLLAVAFTVAYIVRIFGELRARVLLKQDGLVIVRAIRRTWIPWTDVAEVRVRGRSMGRGWVEVVRRNSREVVLPAPVEAYPLLKDQWARASAGHAPDLPRQHDTPDGCPSASTPVAVLNSVEEIALGPAAWRAHRGARGLCCQWIFGGAICRRAPR